MSAFLVDQAARELTFPSSEDSWVVLFSEIFRSRMKGYPPRKKLRVVTCLVAREKEEEESSLL
jgi:hypothetical protein